MWSFLYNVKFDIPAAQKVIASWPTEVVVSPWELGARVPFPADMVYFFGGGYLNPVEEAYKAMRTMPYDESGWDPSAIIYAVEGNKWFTESPAGFMTVDSIGATTFTADPDHGNRRFLVVDNAQASALSDHMVELAIRK